MKKIKVGAVIYAPRVTVIWEMIEKYYKDNGLEIEPVFFKDYKLQVDALEKEKLILLGILLLLNLMLDLDLAEKKNFLHERY